jgi:hypothetical protein
LVSTIILSGYFLTSAPEAYADTITKTKRLTLTGLSPTFDAWTSAGSDGTLNATKLLAVSTDDGDNSYITSTINNDIQGFTSNVVIDDIIESINHINVTSIAHKIDEARKATKFSQGVAQNGVPIALPNGGVELQSGFTTFVQTFEKNPFTAKNENNQDPWVQSDLTNLEFIIEQNTDTKEVRVTQIYVDISYEVAPPSINITSSPSSVKWGHTATIEGTASGFGDIGTITIDWGDGNIDVPFDAADTWSANHEYEGLEVSEIPKTVTATLTVNSETPSDSVDIEILPHITSLDAPTTDVTEVKWSHGFKVVSNILNDNDASLCPETTVLCPDPIPDMTLTYSGSAVGSADDGTTTVNGSNPVAIVAKGSGNIGEKQIIADFAGTNEYLPDTSPATNVTITAHQTSLNSPDLSVEEILWGLDFQVSNTLTDDDAAGCVNAAECPSELTDYTLTYTGSAIDSTTEYNSTVFGETLTSKQISGLQNVLVDSDLSSDPNYISPTQNSSSINLLKHHTAILDLTDSASGATGKPISVTGILVDLNNTNTGISFKPIEISGSGSEWTNTTSGELIEIPDTETGGIVLEDPNINDDNPELEVAECPECVIAGTNPNNRVLLEAGDKIMLERSVAYLTLITEASQNKTITLQVNDRPEQELATDIDAAGTYMILGPNVDNVTINSITGGDGNANLGLIRLIGTSEEANIQILNETVSTLAADLYQTIPIGGGSFGTAGIAQENEAQGLEIIATFPGDDLYINSSASATYDLDANQQDGTELGFGALVNVVADSGIGITGAVCGTDIDGDALCDGWEQNTKAFRVSGQTYYLEIGDENKDLANLYIEIDYMAGHQPDATALQNIKDVFAEHDIIVTTFVDEELPHVDTLNVWTDDDLNPKNDFNSIKANHYQPADERSSATGQSHDISGTGLSRTLLVNGISVTTPEHSSRITIPNGITEDQTQGTINVKTTITTTNPVTLTVPATLTKPSPDTGLIVVGSPTASVLPIPGTEHIVTAKVSFRTTGAINGISLGSLSIPITFSGDPGTVGFDDYPNSPTVSTSLREAYAQMVRYVIFGHGMGGASGTAEFLGNDAVVTLGEGFGDTDAGHAGTEGTTNEQAGTLMHEIGHWLGLKHGGPEKIGTTPVLDSDINCKPNYVSVMTYSRQTPAYLGNAWLLDYSHGLMMSLEEDRLDEGLGLRIDSETNLKTPVVRSNGVVIKPLTSSIPLDEDERAVNYFVDGQITTAPTYVETDINNFGIPGCNTSEISTDPYHDHDDWSNLKFNFRDTVSGSFDASTAIYPTTISDLNASFNQLAQLQSFDLDDPIAVPPPNPDGTTSANGGSTLPIKIPIYLQNSTIPIDYAVLHAEYLTNGTNGNIVTGNVIDSNENRIFAYDETAEFYKLEWNVPASPGGQYWVTVFVADRDPELGALIDIPAIPETCVGLEDPNGECATFTINVVADDEGSKGGPNCEAKPNHPKCQ